MFSSQLCRILYCSHLHSGRVVGLGLNTECTQQLQLKCLSSSNRVDLVSASNEAFIGMLVTDQLSLNIRASIKGAHLLSFADFSPIYSSDLDMEGNGNASTWSIERSDACTRSYLRRFHRRKLESTETELKVAQLYTAYSLKDHHAHSAYRHRFGQRMWFSRGTSGSKRAHEFSVLVAGICSANAG